jgi:hypothetical protein
VPLVEPAPPPPVAASTPAPAATPSAAGPRPTEAQVGRGVEGSSIGAGVLVVGLGLFLLFVQFVPDGGMWIPFIIGLCFLAAFVVKREYGFLVVGSILAGVGIGIVLGRQVPGDLSGPVFMVSLATGFVAIWLISTLLRLPGSHWWPFIPGGILAFVGLLQLTDAAALRWWPLILVAIGLVIIASATRRAQHHT